jgi:ribonuclease T1
MLRVLRLCVVALALWLPGQVHGAPPADGGQNSLPVVAPAELPAEARDTLHAIKQGGPFAYERDGAVFKNYERILPKRPRGYYHEYTVKTPGARNRGARRIISGEVSEYYYTADHYKTFRQIRE